MNVPPDLIGYAAACLTSAAFLPQAWQTWRTRSVEDVSLGMYLAFSLGVALWLAYGLLLSAWPVVLANGFTLTLSLAILTMKLRYQTRPQPEPTRLDGASDA